MIIFFLCFFIIMNDICGAANNDIGHMINKGVSDGDCIGLTTAAQIYLKRAYSKFREYDGKEWGFHRDFVCEIVHLISSGFSKGARFNDFEDQVDLNVADPHGYTLLHYAVLENDAIVVRHLLNDGAKVDMKTKMGNTPLHIVGFIGRHTKKSYQDCLIANTLIKFGADVYKLNNLGYTPLYQATIYDNINMMLFLAAKGANVNVQDRMGQTPLFVAARRLNYETACVLIHLGANREHKDKSGRTFSKVIYNQKERRLFLSRLQQMLKMVSK